MSVIEELCRDYAIWQIMILRPLRKNDEKRCILFAELYDSAMSLIRTVNAEGGLSDESQNERTKGEKKKEERKRTNR